MAQSEATVTLPNPTPPTNMGFCGTTPPNPATFDPTIYNDRKNGMHWAPPANDGTAPPPYFDDGATGALTEFVSAHPLVPVGGTSIEHEGRGTEVIVLAPGNIAHTYQPGGPVVFNTTQAFSCLGAYTSSPNGAHKSAGAPAVAPTITGLVPASTPAAGGGTMALTVNGTGFKPSSVVLVGGVPMNTTYVSATQLKVMSAPKRSTAGTSPVTVNTNGSVTAATNWTFT
jgi:IPT/TIG domain